MAAPDPRQPGPADLFEGSAGPLLRSLLTHAGLGLAVWGTELRCVWANDVLTRYDGVPRERRLGLPPVTTGGGRRGSGQGDRAGAGGGVVHRVVAGRADRAALRSLASSASTR